MLTVPQSHKDSEDIWTGLDEVSMAWIKAMIQDPSVGPSAFYKEECFADIIEVYLLLYNFFFHCDAITYELFRSETITLNISTSSFITYMYPMSSRKIRKCHASITTNNSFRK